MSDRLIAVAKIAEEKAAWASGCGGRCSDGTTTIFPQEMAKLANDLRSAIAEVESRRAKCAEGGHDGWRIEPREGELGIMAPEEQVPFCPLCGAPLDVTP